MDMLTINGARYMACSPDEIVLLDRRELNEWDVGRENVQNSELGDDSVAVLEIKTKLAR